MSQFSAKRRCLLLASTIFSLSILPALCEAPGSGALADPQKMVNSQGAVLEVVRQFRSRPKLQIVNENPEVTNCIATPEASPNYVIAMPAQAVPQASPTIVLTPQGRSVAPVYRGSNIGSGGFQAPGASALPAVRQGGLAPQDKPAPPASKLSAGKPTASPRPLFNSTRDIVGNISTYTPYANSTSGNGFDSRFDKLTQTKVVGSVKPKESK